MVTETDKSATPTSIPPPLNTAADESTNSADARAATAASGVTLADRRNAPRPARSRLWGPITAFAAAAFVVFVMFAPLRLKPPSAASATTPFEDMAIVLEAENLELFRELEFYAWLDTRAPLSDAAGDPAK